MTLQLPWPLQDSARVAGAAGAGIVRIAGKDEAGQKRSDWKEPLEIRVESYAGYRNEQEPRAFWLGERRLEVAELIDRWLSPEHRYFKVRAADGDFYILRYDEARGLWELGAFTRSQTATARGQIPKWAGSPAADDPQ